MITFVDDSAVEINSRALQSFLSVAEHESYTRAAAALALSQPAVHQYVRKLETQLRTKLVEQHGKRVVLTEHGRVVYQYARRLQDEEHDLIRYLRDDLTLGAGQLRIAAGTTASEFILPTVIVAFQRLYPNIQVRVRVTGTNDEVDAGVLDRSYDLGIHSDPTQRPGLDKFPFLSDTLVGIARPDHPFVKAKRPITPAEAAREPFVHFGTSDPGPARVAPIQSLINGWFTTAGVTPSSRLSIGALEGMKRAVRDGGGIAIVSSYAVDPRDHDLATFRLANPPSRGFYVVSRDRGWQSNVVRTFREFTTSLTWAEGDPRNFHRPKTLKGGRRARSV
ncbi:MAG: LysR family transcriptional regulator [Hyphomicrobiales bacterium]